MMMSQRFPNYFDGIVAGAPAMRTSFSNLGLRHAATALKASRRSCESRIVASSMRTQAVIDGISKPATRSTGQGWIRLRAAELPLRSRHARMQGREGGQLPHERAGRRGAHGMQGPRTPSGRQVYPGYFWDTGIATTRGLPGILVGPFIPEGPAAGDTLDVDAAAAAAMDARAMVGDTNAWTNLGTFRAHGGKLIFLHGVSDPWFSAQDTVQYYERLGRDNPGAPLADWSRLFLVPGMGHCGGGERTLDRFDMLDAIVGWVEGARAPERVIATGSSAPGESRPLCPYPTHAHYNGTGEARNEANYRCQALP